MPSSPKIPKETILETAFQILLRDGYGEVNIKNVAKELNCSTQPISWQFGGMDNFRKALLQYCISYVNEKFCIADGDAEQVVERIASTYIDLVCDTPKLYKYLYMDGTEDNKMQELANSMRKENRTRTIDLLVESYKISQEAASRYLLNVEFYVHGIAAYIATGFLALSKESIMDMIHSACKVFLAAEQAD